MKVFTCKDFKGHYPVGAAAVIVAPDIKTAAEMLDRVLLTAGLPQDGLMELRELQTEEPSVVILVDGNY